MSSTRARSAGRVVAIAVAGLLIGSAVAQGMSASAAPAPAAKPKVLTAAQIQRSSVSALFKGGLAVQKDSAAAAAVTTLTKQHRTAEAAAIKQISSQPVAIWLGDWDSKAQLVQVINSELATAIKAAKTPTFVTYAIPNRDCGGYSAGGLTPSQYLSWNQTIANTLRGHRSVVLVEPDSLALLSSCPSVAATRLPLLKSAVTALSSAGVTTYLDGGNSHWVAPSVMAPRLKAAGIGSARGFFTNVSNFYPVADEVAYANKISALTSNAHYVVDVSRNGRGWKGTWCNPSGAGLGKNPAVSNGRTRLDATLWVKTPGASDGTCNGGPSAGSWWESYALALVRLRAR